MFAPLLCYSSMDFVIHSSEESHGIPPLILYWATFTWVKCRNFMWHALICSADVSKRYFQLYCPNSRAKLCGYGRLWNLLRIGFSILFQIFVKEFASDNLGGQIMCWNCPECISNQL